jgi:hypothetical protein
VRYRRETTPRPASGTAKYVFNPVVRGLFRVGLPAPGTAILETAGASPGGRDATRLPKASMTGYRVESQQDFQAVIVKGKPINHALHIIVSLLTGRPMVGRVAVSRCLPEACEEGASVYCSVRPEKIFLDDLEEGMVSVEGEIVQRIYLGTTTRLMVQLAPEVRVVALEQNTARSRAEDRWEIGERVTLGWHPEHCLVLR